MATRLPTSPSTPPPPTSLHTPTTPRFGFDDSYEPFSPRKSTRVSAQRSRIARTPPPTTIATYTSPASSTSSPPTAPKKQTPKNQSNMGGRRVSGALNRESASNAAAALGFSSRPESKVEPVRGVALLPTPAKTPQKRPSEGSAGINAIARNLFSSRADTAEEVMPISRKGRKKYTGFTLDSLEAEETDQPIQIYTDSHDRVPEVDMSVDNPFYGQGSVAHPEPTKRASKRRKITVPGEGEQSVEEVEQREDGLVYVFRGKKIFRKFAEPDEAILETQEENDEDVGLDPTLPGTLRRPLTRSSIKPRLLFPTPEQNQAKQKRSEAAEEEEEAVTDIDEGLSTPTGLIDEVAKTPKAPKFAPASPPTTARTTRSKKIDIDSSRGGVTSDDDPIESPMRHHRGRGAKLSPFDSWQRTKSANTGGSKKREGAPLGRGPGAAKKLRG